MRVLHLIASVNPAGGGPIEGILRLAESDRDLGITREIASLDAQTDPWLATIPLPVHALGGPPASDGRWPGPLPWRRYRWSLRYVRWLNQNWPTYDAFVVDGLWNFTTAGLAASRALNARPFVAFPHGMLDPWFRRTYPIKHLTKQLVWLLADGRVLRQAGAVLFTSQMEEDMARNAFLPYRLRSRVVTYGTAPPPPPTPAQHAAFRAAVPRLGDRGYLLFLGRLHEKKGCDLLIAAFAQAAEQHPELDLVVAGPDRSGYLATLQALAKTLGIASRVHFPGLLLGDAKWGALHGANAFVLPSHQENLGIAVVEAMACGLPVVISDKVAIWREVAAGGCGLVDSDTVEGTARALTRLLALPDDKKRQMGEAGRRLFDVRFRADGAARELDAILRELVAGRPSR